MAPSLGADGRLIRLLFVLCDVLTVLTNPQAGGGVVSAARHAGPGPGQPGQPLHPASSSTVTGNYNWTGNK